MDLLQQNLGFLLTTKKKKTDETYGLPVDVSKPSAFDPLLQNINRRLQSWKARMLSLAGKLILIKSVLEALSIII